MFDLGSYFLSVIFKQYNRFLVQHLNVNHSHVQHKFKCHPHKLFTINVPTGEKLLHTFTELCFLLWFVLCALNHVPVWIIQPCSLSFCSTVRLQLGQSNTGTYSSPGNPWSGLHCADRWMCGGQQSLRQKLHQPHPQLFSGNNCEVSYILEKSNLVLNPH